MMKTMLALGLTLAVAAGCSNSSESPTKVRHYVYRAIGGASMGAMTAAQLGLRYHEMFDILAPSGGALDLTMTVRWFKNGTLGGFCVPPELGKMCRQPGQKQDYENMDCGGPAGGGFDRESMIEAFQDMFIAYGNLAAFNPKNPYLPPGVPKEYIEQSEADECANPMRLPNYYDWEFNPDGKYPAITYCEGDGPVQGVFDPSVVPRKPVEIVLALDMNDNGKRDSGEPLLFRLGERFDDTGVDGKFDKDEPGYDPVSNPDPNGDDYDMDKNPLGTEGNEVYDEGEPFLDYGIDGVPGTKDSPYDWGEGNGHYDFNPHVLRAALMFDPSRLVKNLSQEQLDRLDFYIDVGIRDHLGFCPSSEAFVGILNARGRQVDTRDGYESLLRKDYDGAYDIHFIDWKSVGRDLFIRFGNPNATQAEIDAGDGGHVGSYNQVLYRFFTLMTFVSQRWPHGDFEVTDPSDPARVIEETYHSDILGMDRRYYIMLPPGYDLSPEKRYPVLYLMHGIGMKAEDLTAATLFANPWMIEGTLQKFLIVFPDGRCQGDCFSGTFFANQMGRDQPPRRYEDSFFQELLPHIDASYRTKAPEDAEQP